MPEIEGFYLNKKDKRGGIRIGKAADGGYAVNVITDLSESGKYKIRSEGILRKSGDFYSAELATAQGLTTVIEVREKPDGLQVSFIYAGGSESAEGMEAVDVVDYQKSPDLVLA